MNNIYLCGHTGSTNRGCEAILRSTAKIFETIGAPRATALTFDENYDKRLGLDEVLTLKPYPKRPFLIRALGVARRKLLRDGVWGARFFYANLFQIADARDFVFNVGGDTYCYDAPYNSYALNKLAEERGVPNVFWGCSVDERVYSNPRMRRDVNRYSKIVVRESLSKENLERALDDPSKIILACDPAFQLPIKETATPERFLRGNTVGLNFSPGVFADYRDPNDPMRRNVERLIDYLLAETDMSVCLIPHVYNVEANLQDSDVAGRIFEKYADDERVCVVREELSCSQLKYIISQCRFVVAARTHATIAAYSTGVPTLAISYSIKSLGIAKDLFGTEDQYATSWRKFQKPDDLTTLFSDVLLAKEDEIRERYRRVLPGYKQTIIDAARKVLGASENS